MARRRGWEGGTEGELATSRYRCRQRRPATLRMRTAPASGGDGRSSRPGRVSKELLQIAPHMATQRTAAPAPLEQGCTHGRGAGAGRSKAKAASVESMQPCASLQDFLHRRAGGQQAGRQGLHLEAKRLASHHWDHDDPPAYAHHAAEEARDAACIAAPDRVDLMISGMHTLQVEDKATAGAHRAAAMRLRMLPMGSPRRPASLDIPSGAPSPLPRAGCPVSPADVVVCGCCPLSDSVARCRAVKSLLRFRVSHHPALHSCGPVWSQPDRLRMGLSTANPPTSVLCHQPCVSPR